MQPQIEQTVIPVVQEFFEVGKRVVETGAVRVTKSVVNSIERIPQTLVNTEYVVSRIATSIPVDVPPLPRVDGDNIIFSVVEERLVKQLFVVEEITLTKNIHATTHKLEVTLHRESVVIERQVNVNSPWLPVQD